MSHYGQILISCTVPSGLSFPPSRAKYFTLRPFAASLYSGQCQQCCRFYCLDSFPDFQRFQFPFRAFGDRYKCVTLMFHSFISSLVRSEYLSFCCFWFSLCGLLGRQSPQYSKFPFFFFFFFLLSTKSGLLTEIRGFVCISKSQRILRFILYSEFWFVHAPLSSIVKFQFLAQFPLDHLSHPVVSNLILLLH